MLKVFIVLLLYFIFNSLDIDECLTNPCDTNARCTNTRGSFICQCNSGFAGNGFTCVSKLTFSSVIFISCPYRDTIYLLEVTFCVKLAFVLLNCVKSNMICLPVCNYSFLSNAIYYSTKARYYILL